MPKHIFVPNAEAGHLKELGMDVDCLAGYSINQWNVTAPRFLRVPSYSGNLPSYGDYFGRLKHLIKAPTWTQAFDWILWQFELIGHVEAGLNIVITDKKGEIIYNEEDYFNHIGEARLELLRKLIEECRKLPETQIKHG